MTHAHLLAMLDSGLLVIDPSTVLRAYDLLRRLAPPGQPGVIGTLRGYVSVQRAAARRAFMQDCGRRRRYDAPRYDSRAELVRLQLTLRAVRRAVPNLSAELRARRRR